MIRVTKFTIDATGVVKDIENILTDEDTMLLVHANYAKILDPYVPYDTGYLSQESVEIEPDGVVYTADYAWSQYYTTTFKHKTEYHPLATAFWDKVAMENHYDEMMAKILEIFAERYNNG